VKKNTVNIKPGVSVLSAFRFLNYKTWFAMAEFVDNSVESFNKNQKLICDSDGSSTSLIVKIDIDRNSNRISIKDNAAGIAFKDFPRAFKTAAIPEDRTGLSEFGMGMKSAACWFAPKWTVRTTSIGDPIIRKVSFLMEQIVDDEIEELDIDDVVGDKQHHFTEIILEDIYHLPKGNTVKKLKDHLTDIYKVFIREGKLTLYLNQEELVPYETPILKAPFYKEKDGPTIEWKKDINFDFGENLSVTGFAALRETASTQRAGFSLFRRGRIVEGSADDGYRPEVIFKKPNSYIYQRLFGEFHLNGFNVSHSKDGFKWDENEEPFLELLRDHLDEEKMPLLKQAEGFRARVAKKKLETGAKNAVDDTAEEMETNLPTLLDGMSECVADEEPTSPLPKRPEVAAKTLKISHAGSDWIITIRLVDDPAESQWLAISDQAPEEKHRLEIRVSTSHPFMIRFAQVNEEALAALLRVAASLAIAEITARDAGVKQAGAIRRNVNEILLGAFSDHYIGGLDD